MTIFDEVKAVMLALGRPPAVTFDMLEKADLRLHLRMIKRSGRTSIGQALFKLGYTPVCNPKRIDQGWKLAGRPPNGRGAKVFAPREMSELQRLKVAVELTYNNPWD
jgi:hypothetical protein